MQAGREGGLVLFCPCYVSSSLAELEFVRLSCVCRASGLSAHLRHGCGSREVFCRAHGGVHSRVHHELLGSRHEGRERQVRHSKRAHGDDACDPQRRS